MRYRRTNYEKKIKKVVNPIRYPTGSFGAVEEIIKWKGQKAIELVFVNEDGNY
jgi:hypothetical protein